MAFLCVAMQTLLAKGSSKSLDFMYTSSLLPSYTCHKYEFSGVICMLCKFTPIQNLSAVKNYCQMPNFPYTGHVSMNLVMLDSYVELSADQFLKPDIFRCIHDVNKVYPILISKRISVWMWNLEGHVPCHNWMILQNLSFTLRLIFILHRTRNM